MRIKKTSIIFFAYALLMLWPDYFHHTVTGLLENLFAAVVLVDIINNRKHISKFSILAAVYFIYTVANTLIQGGGDIHTLISSMKIVLFIMAIDVHFQKDDAYETISVLFWIISIFSLINFVTVVLFPDGMYQVVVDWNEWGSTSSSAYWILGYKNSHAFWYLLLELLAALRWYCRPSANNRYVAYGCALVSVLASILVKSSTATIACLTGAIGIFGLVWFRNRTLFKRNWNGYWVLIGNFAVNILLITGMTGFLSPIVQTLFGKDLTFSNRTRAWAAALLSFLKKPIFGTGILTSEQAIETLGSLSYMQAHNEWLQCLWQGGIVLFIILLLILFSIAKENNQLQNSKLNLMSNMFFIAVFLEMAFEARLDSQLTWLMLLLIFKMRSIEDNEVRLNNMAGVTEIG